MSRKPPKAKHARSIVWRACTCGCGVVNLALLDARGRLIATAELSAGDLVEMGAALFPEDTLASGVSLAVH